MTVLKVEASSDEGELEGFVYDDEAVVRIVGDEEGVERSGLNRWFNSARIHADPEQDEVTCVVSVGDPRGGFAFTVRRKSDGTLLLHTPHPGEGAPHMRLKELHPGTYEVVGDRGEAVTFEDEEEMDREPGWRDGWDEMVDGDSNPEDSDAPYGISFSNKNGWRVVERDTTKVPRGLDDVTDYDTADEAAERAEELNDEALEEED